MRCLAVACGLSVSGRPGTHVVQGHGQLWVGFPRRVYLGFAFVQSCGQIGGSLFHASDHPLHFLNVGGGAEAGLAPDLFPQRLGQTLLQLLNARDETGDAGVGVGHTGLN